MKEASSADTPYGPYTTSEGWLVLNLEDARTVGSTIRATPPVWERAADARPLPVGDLRRRVVRRDSGRNSPEPRAHPARRRPHRSFRRDSDDLGRVR
jgi:hypothetical protein